MSLAGLVVAICAVLAMPVAAVASGGSSSPSEPQTEPVELTSTGVKLKGTLNPEGAPIYYSFTYRESGAAECEEEWGCAPVTPRTGPLTGSTSQEASAEVQFAHLRPGKTYVYWLIVESEAGVRLARSAAGQFEVPVPAIDSESASHVTSTDATLEATINPGQRAIRYQFQIAENPSELRSELVCPTEVAPPYTCLGEHMDGALPLGFIGTEHEEYAAANGPDARLDLASAGVTLRPDTTYYYRVLGAPEIATVPSGFWWERPAVVGPEQTFTTPPAGQAPVIESVSVSHLTSTDATLEAQIDTEGLSTSYEFQMWSSPCSHKGAGCELMVEVPLPTGLLLGSFVPQTVSLDLNGAGVTLGGGEYGFSVVATNKAGSASVNGGVFEAPAERQVGPSSGPFPPPPAPVAAQMVPVDRQSAGSGDPSSSSTPDIGVGGQTGGTGKLEPLPRSQKLAKALKQCEKEKSKSKRAACEKVARKTYDTAVKLDK
ncbi:MAG: hypothetical protein WBQ21_06795 [Solirubrobacteraceae bacterium]